MPSIASKTRSVSTPKVPPKPPVAATAASITSNSAADLYERICRRAYELYEQRGRLDGFAEQDWLQAEAELTTARIA
jgi:hypothetical protein